MLPRLRGGEAAERNDGAFWIGKREARREKTGKRGSMNKGEGQLNVV